MPRANLEKQVNHWIGVGRTDWVRFSDHQVVAFSRLLVDRLFLLFAILILSNHAHTPVHEAAMSAIILTRQFGIKDGNFPDQQGFGLQSLAEWDRDKE